MVVTTHYGDISLDNTTWDVTWSYLPHRCLFTGKWIMPFTSVIHGHRIGFGLLNYTGQVARQYYWTTQEEFTVQKLKGNV